MVRSVRAALSSCLERVDKHFFLLVRVQVLVKVSGRQTKQSLVLVAMEHPKPVLEVREGGLEPAVGRGCDKEDGETPHRVGDGGPLDKVGQGHQHPLVEHRGLVLVAGLVEHSKQHPGQKNLMVVVKSNNLQSNY